MAVVIVTAALVGSTCALFLTELARATTTQQRQPWLLFFLPLAGVAIVWMYRLFGGRADQGNNLILEAVHRPDAGVPLRMTPLVLAATIVTHLFGGSSGREGTAVQMGGSLAYNIGRVLHPKRREAATLLRCGMAAGFGGVFGTPLAAAMFAAEVTTIGRLHYRALPLCLLAGLIGDRACAAWGVHHTAYHIAVSPAGFQWNIAARVAVAGIAFGLAARAFAGLTHALGHAAKRWLPIDWTRPIVGGVIVIGLVYALGTRDYLGLGITPPPGGHVSILTAFAPGGADTLSFGWKILFTALMLATGFKGGEVTPLFFVGATLGNVIARFTGGPTDLLAGMGFVAVFAGAAKTPLACTVMAIELFGGEHAVYAALACFLAYAFSGHGGIYLTQRRRRTAGLSPARTTEH